MTFPKYATLLPLAFLAFTAQADDLVSKMNGDSTFQFSTEVSRTVDKDLMQVEVFSRKNGKNLAALKQTVSGELNKVLAVAKKHANIEISTNGVSNYADYNDKGKVVGWVAEGRIELKSKDFGALAEVLDNLGENVAIGQIDFSVSDEKMQALEDEMTMEIIKQFQHKAEVIQKGLGTKNYVLTEVNLETPNGEGYYARPMLASARMAKMADEAMPLEAGKAKISARASGKVKFE